jgi:hypothetical protein
LRRSETAYHVTNIAITATTVTNEMAILEIRCFSTGSQMSGNEHFPADFE